MRARRVCGGTNAEGAPCSSPIVGADGFFPAHRPGCGERMKRLATKGALASRKSGLDPDDLPTLYGPRTASLWLDRVGRAVATGRLGHREGTAVVRAVEAFLRAHDAGEVTDDLARMREALKAWTKTGDTGAILEVLK